jgi:hypothetical protein
MKRLNNKGFEAVKAVLILVCVGIISLTGYYMYATNKNTRQTLDNTVKGQGQVQKTTETTATNKVSPKSDNTTSTPPPPKGQLTNTYNNKECSFSLKYPDGFTVSNFGATNTTLSSANFQASDHSFMTRCTAGDESLISSYSDYPTGTLTMKERTISPGYQSYYIISKNAKLITITFTDPNSSYQAVKTQILATLALN